MVKFTSDLLKDVMGEQVFEKPPELERAHRALAPKPRDDQPPRPIIVCFHRYQDKEQALRWVRNDLAAVMNSGSCRGIWGCHRKWRFDLPLPGYVPALSPGPGDTNCSTKGRLSDFIPT